MKILSLAQLILSLISISLAARPRQGQENIGEDGTFVSDVEQYALAQARNRANPVIELIRTTNNLGSNTIQLVNPYLQTNDERTYRNILNDDASHYVNLHRDDDFRYFGIPATAGDTRQMHLLKVYHDGRVSPLGTIAVNTEMPDGATFWDKLLQGPSLTKTDMTNMFSRLRIVSHV